MRRALGCAAVLVSVAACRVPVQQDPVSPPASSAAVSPKSSPASRDPEFFLPAAVHHTKVLAEDIGPRPAGSPGEARAAAYLEEVLTRAGYSVARHEARRSSGISYNIVARSKADYSSGWILVGAHYDTVPPSPGGNDNGTGTAVVLALAEAFSSIALPVEFVGFAAEEYETGTREHHVGSRAYAASLPDPKLVKAMISIDMVGNGALQIVRFRGYPDDLQREVAVVARSMGIDPSLSARGDQSDHTSFAPLGIPAAWLWTGDHRALHSSADTFGVVRPEDMGAAGRVAFEWLRRRVS